MTRTVPQAGSRNTGAGIVKGKFLRRNFSMLFSLSPFKPATTQLRPMELAKRRLIRLDPHLHFVFLRRADIRPPSAVLIGMGMPQVYNRKQSIAKPAVRLLSVEWKKGGGCEADSDRSRQARADADILPACAGSCKLGCSGRHCVDNRFVLEGPMRPEVHKIGGI